MKVTVLDGSRRNEMTVGRFLGLPLLKRVQLILSGSLTFEENGVEIATAVGLARLRKESASLSSPPPDPKNAEAASDSGAGFWPATRE